MPVITRSLLSCQPKPRLTCPATLILLCTSLISGLPTDHSSRIGSHLGMDTFVRNGSGTQSLVFGRIGDHNVFPRPVTGMRVGYIPKARNSINTIWRTMVTRLNLAPKIFAICGGRRSGIRIGSSSSTSAQAQNTLPPWLPTMPTSIHGPRNTSHGTVCRWGRIQTSLVYGQLYSPATQIRVSGQAGTGVVSEDRARLLELQLEP